MEGRNKEVVARIGVATEQQHLTKHKICATSRGRTTPSFRKVLCANQRLGGSD
jgi:hypothetical protein